MPLTLVTGLPGHGKTLYTLFRWKAEAEKEGRPVFHNGIKGCNIPGWQTWKPEEWEQLPAGAIMVIDECQDVFPIRGRGQPPSWIENFAKHRHLGLDFIFITQNPMLIDTFIRRLIDRHFHIARKFGTHWATIYEFTSGCRDSVHTNKKDAIRHEWRYPKEVFSWYTSAELHTVKKRLPARVYVLAAAPLVFGALVYLGYQRLNPEAQQQRIEEQVATDPNYVPSSGNGGGSGGRYQPPEHLSTEDYVAAYQPRIPDLPHTAPAYDDLTKPKQVPFPAACVSSSTRCKCYTQQATPLQITDAMCRDIAKTGIYLAWLDPQTGEVKDISTSPTAAPGAPGAQSYRDYSYEMGPDHTPRITYLGEGTAPAS